MNAPHRPVPRHIILFGEMGSGKTSVGSRLATLLGRHFFDSDKQIETHTGSTGAAIAVARGVVNLHALERDVFLEAVATAEAAVIAAAASVADSPEALAAAEGAWCFRLDADAATLAQRRTAGDHRRSAGAAELDKLAATRADALAGLILETLDTGLLGVDGCVRVIGAHLDGHGHQGSVVARPS